MNFYLARAGLAARVRKRSTIKDVAGANQVVTAAVHNAINRAYEKYAKAIGVTDADVLGWLERLAVENTED